MKDKKKITQFSGDELVNIVSKTITCPICGQECENQFEVYAHISAEHPPTVGEAS